MAIKVYGMESCPNCIAIKPQIEGNPRFSYVDIGSHVRLLKEFIRLRDASPAFDEAKRKGLIGIPCFVLESGEVTLDPAKAALAVQEGASCSLEDHRLGKKGC